MALFEGKQNVHLYVRFLAKLGAPLSSELLTTLATGYLSKNFENEHGTIPIVNQTREL